MTALRAAILGAGMIGEVHRRSILMAGGVLVGVVASSPSRSAEVGEAWGVRGYADVQEVLDAGVDVVHICTPNAAHADQVRAVLAAGRHVVCEKPLGLTAAEAVELQGLAAAAGVIATVPFVYRYHPLVREIRARAANGAFGEWLMLHGSYLQDWLLSPDTSNWRVDPDKGGASRAVADIGSHWFDLVEWVAGLRFDSVAAATTVAFAERSAEQALSFRGASHGTPRTRVATEDGAVVLLRSGGVLASTVISQVAAGRKNRLWFELDGTGGSAAFDQEQPEAIWLGTEQGATLIPRGAGGSAEEQRLSVLPPGHAQGYAQCFEAFVADTYAAVRGTVHEGLPTFDDGVRAARFVEAVLASDRSGSWMEIEP